VSAELQETLRDEVLVAVRRLGTERVHFALVMPETIRAGAHFGAPCEWIDAPVSSWCRRTLRGRLVHIPRGEMLDSWKRNGKVCRECVLIAQLALERVPHV
jgi:hypothetical protein